MFFHRPVAGSFLEPSLRNLLLQGGGLRIDGSSNVKFEDCEIYSNCGTYTDVGAVFEPFPERSSIAPLREVSWN